MNGSKVTECNVTGYIMHIYLKQRHSKFTKTNERNFTNSLHSPVVRTLDLGGKDRGSIPGTAH